MHFEELDDLLEAVRRLIADSDTTPGKISVLDVEPSAELAAALPSLGPAIDMNVVSPPIRDPDRPESRPPWDYKQSVCHEIEGQRVWFGTETTDGVKRLVSVAIHHDQPAADRLPPEGRDGPMSITVSLGWCGGHGEAVLDESQHVRRHDDLPVFVDSKSWDEVHDTLDFSGSFQGTPVVRVKGTGRLERRKARNSSIPGAPKEKFIALIVSSFSEARVEGERAE